MQSTLYTFSYVKIQLCAFLLLPLTGVAVSIDTVFVGDAGNANDSTGYGKVDYEYRIGKYEVTNSQFIDFLHAKAQTDDYDLYNEKMSTHQNGGITRTGDNGSYTYSLKPDMGNKPLTNATYWTALRFANWLTNGGQVDSDTEDGMYTLTTEGISNNTFTRNSDAWENKGVAITSEDEWYKAAYYKGGSLDAGYWDYAHQSDSITTDDANYGNPGGPLTDVGSYQKAGAYGTFDQSGNVSEFTEAISIYSGQRIHRGGSMSSSPTSLRPTTRYSIDTNAVYNNMGFRITSLGVVPEPSTSALIFGCLALSVTIINRRRCRTL